MKFFSGEPAPCFGFPPNKTCFMLGGISKQLLSPGSTSPGITWKRLPLFQYPKQNPTVIPNPPEH